jgi:urease beta subunit
LFKNNGTTPITNGTFITFAEGNAGLKFTPGITNGSFNVQSSLSASDAGLGGGTATAAITINPIGGALRFSSGNYSVAEGAGSRTITVERSGDTSLAVTVDYISSDHSNPADFLPCTSPGAGFASSRCDFTTAVGTLRFAAGETTKTFNVLISQDNYVEGPETLSLTLSNPTGGAVFGVPQTATLSITDDATEPAINQVDVSSEFVRSQYHDFLNREPDAPGLAFWTDNIEKCNDPARRPAGQTAEQCVDKQRESTAVAFFMAPEFQITGGFVYHLYKGSLTGSPNYDGGSLGRFPTSLEFLRDLATVSEGIMVNNQISGRSG